jgi:predicted TIM-barrel enzyme
MVKAGADVLVAHMGLTNSGAIGVTIGKTLDECAGLVQEIREKAMEVNPNILVLCRGGPIAEPRDAKYVLSRMKGDHGFFGASGMKRLLVETAIKNTTAKFKGLKLNNAR